MNREIVESFADMVKMKGIDKDVLAGILEDVFTLLVRKKYGEEALKERAEKRERIRRSHEMGGCTGSKLGCSRG